MQNVKKLKQNPKGRMFVVGDIHGCFTKLQLELFTLGFDESKDWLFSVGDLVDRGPESEKAVQWLKKPWFHAVKGNHEKMACDAAIAAPGHYKEWYVANGGAWWYELGEEDQTEIVEQFSYLPYVIEIEMKDGRKIGILHAEPFGSDWDTYLADVQSGWKYALEQTLWKRTNINTYHRSKGIGTPILPPAIRGVDRIYVGHTPVDDPVILHNVHYIDTGAVFKDGRLTILEIE